MRRKRPLIIFAATLLFLVLMPQSVASGLRSTVSAILMPRGGSEARVIYRSPATWSSALWINAGTAQGVEKDCPVVVGHSLIGVVDEVGKHQSRVRLITDSGLSPSVRVLRGGEANRELQWHLDMLKLALPELNVELDLDAPNFHLAKGEIHGSGNPLWRGQGNRLKGIGFNYDHADRYGLGRDLRTGEPFDRSGPAVPILEVGDLLVTTGMDGLFPEGLHVARVTYVEILREGASFYELEAIPTAGDMNEITSVVVLPPIMR